MEIVTSNTETTNKTGTTGTEEKTAESLVGMSAAVDSQIEYINAIDSINNKQNKHVVITDDHKNAFLSCLITGERYKENFNLFGGKLKITIRCRSAEETDAILSRLARETTLGTIKSDYEYSAEMRILMIIAQVEKINDVIYPEMKKPLLPVADGDKIIPPAWLDDFNTWKSKPEVMLSAVSTAIAEFEARYWKMISESENINFWQPGGSTEQ